MVTASPQQLRAYLERFCGGKGSGVPGPCGKGRDQAHLTMRAHANAAQAAAKKTADALKKALDAHANANHGTQAGAEASAKLEDAQAAHDDASQKAARLAGKARELEHQQQVQQRVRAAASAKRAGSGAAKPAGTQRPAPAAKAPEPEPAKQPAPAAPKMTADAAVAKVLDHYRTASGATGQTQARTAALATIKSLDPATRDQVEEKLGLGTPDAKGGYHNIDDRAAMALIQQPRAPAAKAPEPAKQPAPAAAPKAPADPGPHLAATRALETRAGDPSQLPTNTEIDSHIQGLRSGASKDQVSAVAKGLGLVKSYPSKEAMLKGIRDHLTSIQSVTSRVHGLSGDSTPKPPTGQPVGRPKGSGTAVPEEHVSHVVNAVKANDRGANLAPLEKVREHLAGAGVTDRTQQDAAINEARKRGLVSGSGAEGRQGTTPAARAAAIPEEGGHSIGHLSIKQGSAADTGGGKQPTGNPVGRPKGSGAAPEAPAAKPAGTHPLAGADPQQVANRLYVASQIQGQMGGGFGGTTEAMAAHNALASKFPGLTHEQTGALLQHLETSGAIRGMEVNGRSRTATPAHDKVAIKKLEFEGGGRNAKQSLQPKDVFENSNATRADPSVLTKAIAEHIASVSGGSKHAERFSEGGAQIRHAEIFTTGIHRGKEYTTADLDTMVENFSANCTGAKPLMHIPAVLGHEEDQSFLERSDLPAAGWVSHLYREGNSLYADFGEVAPQVANLIKAHRYRTVSAEIYDEPPEGIPGNGKLLRRVAFLGADQPQIKAISDIPMPEAHNERFASWRPVLLKFRECKPAKSGAWFCFAEVAPMDPDQAKQQLIDLGADPDKVAAMEPDEVMDMLRVCNGLKEQAQPSQPMDDNPMSGDVTQPAQPMADQPMQYGENDDDDDPGSAEGAMQMAERTAKYLDKYCGTSGSPQMQPPQQMGDGTPPPPPMPAQPMADMGVSNTPPTHPSNPTVGPMHPNQHPKSVTMKYDEQMKRAEAKIARIDKMAEERLASAKKSAIKTELDALVADGKVLPSERPDLDEIMLGLDATRVQKFADTGADGKRVEVNATPFDRMLAKLKDRPILVSFAERVKGGQQTTPEEAEVAKVQRFAESDAAFQHVLKIQGKTPADYVAKFKELKAKKPSLTAREYGVLA